MKDAWYTEPSKTMEVELSEFSEVQPHLMHQDMRHVIKGEYFPKLILNMLFLLCFEFT